MSQTLWLFLVSTPKPREYAAPPIDPQDTDESETKTYTYRPINKKETPMSYICIIHSFTEIQKIIISAFDYHIVWFGVFLDNKNL